MSNTRERAGRWLARTNFFASRVCIVGGIVAAIITAAMSDGTGVMVSLIFAVGGGLLYWIQGRAWAGFAERNRKRDESEPGG